MDQVRSWAGLDVHAAKVVAAVVDGESGELSFRRLGGSTSEVAAFCGGLPGRARVAFEAGPTGFGPARALEAKGAECLVAAPGKIARAPQDRVKTDRRDAERIVRLLMAGDLSAVRVPSPEEEALRDVVRAREDLLGDLMRARHRVAKLLLRHDRRFDGRNWTARHRDWLSRVELSEPVAQIVLLDGIGAIDALCVRREALERQMAELVPASPWADTVARLKCLRGIDIPRRRSLDRLERGRVLAALACAALVPLATLLPALAALAAVSAVCAGLILYETRAPASTAAGSAGAKPAAHDSARRWST